MLKINVKNLVEEVVNVMELDSNEGMNKMLSEVVSNLTNIGAENDQEIVCHIKDVANYGAATGAVAQVIYTQDNENFYRKYAVEIFDFCDQVETYLVNKTSIDNIVWSIYEAVAAALMVLLQ